MAAILKIYSEPTSQLTWNLVGTEVSKPLVDENS